ncbi:MAG: AI-2E family transporter [Anaerotruncus sp.]|nr:AI-2E family transporter [Anaerotruncus sp.]
MLQNRNNLRNLFLIAAGIVLLNWSLQNLALLSRWLWAGIGLLTPFLLGLCIAFILNVPMKALEAKLFAPSATRRTAALHRICSLLLTILLVLFLLILVVFIVYPELRDTVRLLSNRIPGFLAQASLWLETLSQKHPDWDIQLASQLQQINWEEIGKTLLGFLQNGATSILNSTFNVATSVFSGIFHFVLGLVFAIYLLLQRETLGRQLKKLLYAYLPEAVCDRTIYISRLSNRIFSNFLTGQCLEAVILGAMFFIAMSLLRMPYALMVSVLVAFTALIPVFGAFIGCGIGAFLILVNSPLQALWFVVLFLVLQQIEGNLIYPKVVGSSVGLPGIWVLAAVTVGGSAFGVLGMLVMVPLMSVVYALVRESVHRRLCCREIPAEKYQ